MKNSNTKKNQHKEGKIKMGKNKKTKFRSFMKKYIIVLCILAVIFLAYVMNTLYQYEDSFTDTYMNSYITDLSKSAKSGKIDKYCNFENIQVNEFETNKDGAKQSLENIIKTSNISYKLEDANKTTQEPVYGIYANDQKIMDVTLSVKKQNKRLSLFTYPTWQVKQTNVNSGRGMFYYDILVPSNYTVTVNSNKLSEKNISETKTDEDYEILAKYANLPKMVNYKLDNFVTNPEIKISDENGKEVKFSVNNHKIELSSLHKSVNTYDEAKQYLQAEIDVLELAKKWSLFLTDDLTGPRHGFNELSNSLVKDTELYNMAYSWATSVDITFTSKHTFKDPAFTNTSVKDFEIYGKNAFSCTVYLEKNMLIANGNDKIDVMHDKLYFAYIDDTKDGKDNPQWKMVAMKAVTDNK